MTTAANENETELLAVPATVTVDTTLHELGQQTRKLTVDPRGVDESWPFIIERVRHDENIQVESLEHFLTNPRRQKGTVTVHDPADFA
ncbi:MAG: hypothetical protein HOV67_34660, partial [Kribbellaceae bacterium]|nr:hypothetical protein [Kribbellaceae bacterium]